jgi:hypothetical protein
MNVLILTPDAVGSTLLQRLVTIYMQFHQYSQPVINLHELTNGLTKYYSPDFNREILGKPEQPWGYFQSLEEIVRMLDSCDHFKTSRLAHYHIRNRKDTLPEQIPFYQYLNQNFFIISCRRENVFEHALSMGINAVTKKLNVYSAGEKINAFFNLYKDQLTIDTKVIVRKLEDYRSYLDWCETHFDVASYFEYDSHLKDIEKYIINLPIFAGQSKISWKDTYGIEFADWNRCHYYTSDIGSLAIENSKNFAQLTNNTKADTANTEIAPIEIRDLIQHLPEDRRTFLKDNYRSYIQVNKSIDRMIELGIMFKGVPIKKQTLKEKQFMIKNFDECVEVYNDWIAANPTIGQPVTDEYLIESSNKEQPIWQPEQEKTPISTTVLSSLLTTD